MKLLLELRLLEHDVTRGVDELQHYPLGLRLYLLLDLNILYTYLLVQVVHVMCDGFLVGVRVTAMKIYNYR